MIQTVEGIEAGAVSDWFRERTEVTPPLDFEVIAGGRSNLTYTVTDASGRRWVLRRPPLHSVLASAHDVGREHRIMEALQHTAVPVPPLVGMEPDPEVTGAPFYVMEFVDGLVPRDEQAVTSTLDEDARRAVAFNLADTLADLHAVDVDEVGLGDLAKRTDYIARQHLDALDHAADHAARLASLLQLHHGHMPKPQARASLRLTDLTDNPRVVQFESDYVLDQALAAWQQAALDAVRDVPADRGAYVTDVASAVGRAGCPKPLRRPVIDRLCAQQHLHAHGDILTDPATSLTYLDARAQRQAAVVEAISHDPLSPPDLDEITRTVHVVGSELQGLFEEGRLIQVGDVVVTGTAIDLATQLLRDQLGDQRFTASQAREVWGTTRKYAVPLLEHLARIGITTFDGTHHHLTAAGRSPQTDTAPGPNTHG